MPFLVGHVPPKKHAFLNIHTIFKIKPKYYCMKIFSIMCRQLSINKGSSKLIKGKEKSQIVIN